MEIEVEICDRCGECFSWHGEVNGIRKVKTQEHGYECSPEQVIRSLPLLHGKAERLAERRTEVSKKVSDILPKTEILAQLAEEASELAQAALKLRRALDGTNPTPKNVEECLENIQEEMADDFCLSNHVWQVRRKRWNLDL